MFLQNKTLINISNILVMTNWIAQKTVINIHIEHQLYFQKLKRIGGYLISINHKQKKYNTQALADLVIKHNL